MKGEGPVTMTASAAPKGGAARAEAIARRLRDMLLRQKEIFQRYLQLLEQEELSIENGDAAGLQAYLEMEKGLITDVQALRKVIDPLEEMYKAAYPRSEETVPPLKADVEVMADRIRERNARNRAALEARMGRLKEEISGLRARPRMNVLFSRPAPSLVDIRT